MRILRNKRTGEVISVDESELGKFRIAQAQTQTPMTPNLEEPDRESLLATLLPLLGGIAGGGIGSLLGPAGTIAGGAIGSGLGETARQGISGKPLRGGKILGETALGALGGIGGALKVAKAGKAVSAASKVGKVASKADDLNNLQKAGKGLRRTVAEPLKSTSLKSKAGITSKADEIAGNMSKYKGSAISKLAQSDADYATQLEKIKTIMGNPKVAKIPVSGKDLVRQVTSESALDFDITTGVGKTNINFWANKIKGAKTVTDLNKINTDLLKASANASKEKKAIIESIRRPVSERLKTLVPQLKEPFRIMSESQEMTPVLRKGTSSTVKIPIAGNQISAQPFQAAADYVGRGLEGAGNLASKYELPLSLAKGQTGAQIGGGILESLASPGETPTEGYTGATGEESPMTSGATNQYSQPGPEENTLGLTAEKVALAKLLLPKEQADRIEAAWEILGGGKSEKERTEGQIARSEVEFLVDDAIARLEEGGVATGPIGPKIEEFKSIFNRGDQSTIELNKTISSLMASIARARAGTTFTEGEKALLEQYAPKVGDSRQQLMSKLLRLQTVRRNVK